MEPDARVGPFLAQMMVVDEVCVVLPGQDHPSGNFTAGWTSPRWLEPVLEIWSRTGSVARPFSELVDTSEISRRQIDVAKLLYQGRTDDGSPSVGVSPGPSATTPAGSSSAGRRVTPRAGGPPHPSVYDAVADCQPQGTPFHFQVSQARRTGPMRPRLVTVADRDGGAGPGRGVRRGRQRSAAQGDGDGQDGGGTRDGRAQM